MSGWRAELKTVEIEKRRWAVLAHLEKSKPTRALNADILTMGCRAAGIPTTSDEMDDTLLWLAERQYLSIEALGSMCVASISQNGREIAQQIRTVPGLIPFGLDS